MTAMVDQAPARPPPRPFRLAMLIPTLLVDAVAPIAIFKGLEGVGASPVWALAAACVPPALNNLRVWIRSRRLEPVGILIVGSMAGGAVASLVAGDIAWRILADLLVGGAWALVFLGSLVLGRPLMVYIIRPLVAGEDASRIAAWNGLWRYATFRSRLRAITVTWGAVYVALMLIEAGLSRFLKAETVLTIAPLTSLGATLALIMFTRQRMRSLRERFEVIEHQNWPL
jgi:hypothetical protein